MKYFKKIVGERIYLSPMSVDDAETYVKWMNSRDVSDRVHSTHKMINVEDEREWIKRILEKGSYDFAIILSETDELIGNCSINKISFIDGTATLGIFIGEEENRNKGYGSEALNLLLDYGFNILNLNNIDLGVISFNERAIKCYKKIGFKEYSRRHECYYLDGKYHDILHLEMLKKDYINKSQK